LNNSPQIAAAIIHVGLPPTRYTAIVRDLKSSKYDRSRSEDIGSDIRGHHRKQNNRVRLGRNVHLR